MATTNGSTLIFFTSTYPYGVVETFIEAEISYLASAFNRIIIVTNNLADTNLRFLPSNVTVIRHPYFSGMLHKVKATSYAISPFVIAEILNIRNHLKLKLNKQTLSILFGSVANALAAYELIEKIVRDENITTNNLYLYSYWLNDMAIGIARFKDKHPEVKAFSRAHRWDIYQDEQPGKYAALRPYLLSHLNMCYSISSNGVNYLNNITENKFTDKVKVGRLGTFNKEGVRNADNSNRFQLLSCSYLIDRKRIHLIVEALSASPHLNITWTHLGGGPMLDELNLLAKEKLSGAVTYNLKGLMTASDIYAYYKNNHVDLFINVSESEGVPVSIMEAFSFGIPAIATNTGGVADIVNDQTGFLLDVNCTPEIIAESILNYYYLPSEKKEQYRLNAFEKWDKEYNAEKNYRAFVADILSL